MEPLATGQDSQQILAAFEESDFDANLLKTDQVLAINVAKVNADFRINERVFKETLASRPDLAIELSDKISGKRDTSKKGNI